MTNKRSLKRTIKLICEEMFTECVATSLHASERSLENIEALLFTIIRIQEDYTARISHPEPGMPAKEYFRDLREKFSSQCGELIDQINNIQ